MKTVKFSTASFIIQMLIFIIIGYFTLIKPYGFAQIVIYLTISIIASIFISKTEIKESIEKAIKNKLLKIFNLLSVFAELFISAVLIIISLDMLKVLEIENLVIEINTPFLKEGLIIIFIIISIRVAILSITRLGELFE